MRTFHLISNTINTKNLTAENLQDALLGAFVPENEIIASTCSNSTRFVAAERATEPDAQYPIFTITTEDYTPDITPIEIRSNIDNRPFPDMFKIHIAKNTLNKFKLVNASLDHVDGLSEELKAIVDLSGCDLGTESDPVPPEQAEPIKPIKNANSKLAGYIERQRKTEIQPESEKKSWLPIRIFSAVISHFWYILPYRHKTHLKELDAANTKFTAAWNTLFGKMKSPANKEAATGLLSTLETLMNEPGYGKHAMVNGNFKATDMHSPTDLQARKWMLRQVQRLGGDTKPYGEDKKPKPAQIILDNLQAKAADPKAIEALAAKVKKRSA